MPPTSPVSSSMQCGVVEQILAVFVDVLAALGADERVRRSSRHRRAAGCPGRVALVAAGWATEVLVVAAPIVLACSARSTDGAQRPAQPRFHGLPSGF